MDHFQGYNYEFWERKRLERFCWSRELSRVFMSRSLKKILIASLAGMLIFSMIPGYAGSPRHGESPQICPSEETGPVVLYSRHVESFSRVNAFGIAVGHSNQLSFSSNLGRSWTVLGTLPESNIIKQILWLDSLHIIVNASYTGHGVIFCSNNGGKNFSASLRNTGANESIVWDTAAGVLYTLDNKNVFWMSSDQGQTWRITGGKIPFQQRQNVSHFCSLTALSEGGPLLFYATTAYPGRIFRSVDTGKHWQRIFTDSIILRNREIPHLSKLSDGRLFAVSAEGSVDAPGYALLGTSIGDNWTLISVPQGLWYSVELPSQPGCIVTAGFGTGRSLTNSAVFITHDFGQNWLPHRLLGACLGWKLECIDSGSQGRPSKWLVATEKGLLLTSLESQR